MSSSAGGSTALLLDEMLSGVIADRLRQQGLDAVAVVEDPALIGTADDELLDYAATQHRVLVTANVADFAALAADRRAAGRRHAGLVHVTNRGFPQDRSFVGAIVTALHALHNTDGLPPPGTETFLRRT